jgi:hypothetical protein
MKNIKYWYVVVGREVPADYHQETHTTRRGAFEEARRLIEGGVIDHLGYVRVFASTDLYQDRPLMQWAEN